MFWHRPLNNQNVLAYASAYYYNPRLGWEEFYEDFGQFKRLNSLFAKLYIKPDEMQLRIVLNKMIFFGNCFINDSLGRLSFYYVSKESHSNVYTILKFLRRLPEITFETSLEKLVISQKVASLISTL